MSFNPKPLQVPVDGQPARQNPPVQPPPSQAPKVPPQAAPQIQVANNFHAQLHLQQQMSSFQQPQALLFPQQPAANPTSEPLELTRVVTEAAAKQANGNVSVTPQAASHGPTAAHQIHTTSLKLTYKPATTSQPPAHMSSQPTSIQQQHHTASVATASQAQVQHTPQQQPTTSQQKVPSPQKAAPPPLTRAPVAVATTTAAQSQLQANNNVPKAPSPTTPQKSTPAASQPPKLATVVTPSKTTMKLATVTTPRIKQTARKNQAALSRPQSNFAAAAEAAAATKPSTSAPVVAEVVTKTAVAKTAPPQVVEKEKKEEKPKAESVKVAQQPLKKEKPTPAAKTPKHDVTDGGSSRGVKRSRTRTVPYQSPLPEYAMLTKLSYAESSSSGSKSGEDKLVLFYKSEFMAVRNAEGGFFLCQAQHNVYKSSPRIRIQWLSEEKINSPMYIPDFYDVTDLECVLTSVEMEKKTKKLYKLPEGELERIQNILKKAIDVEKGILPRPDVTEENPDGLDLSLYKDESQLDRSPKKRASSDAGSPKRVKRTKADATPKRKSTRTKSPRKNFAESDFETSDEEEPPKMAQRVGRPLISKAPPVTVTPAKAPVKSKATPQKQQVVVTEVVVEARGRKRKADIQDSLAATPAKKTSVQMLPDTPAAAAGAKASPVKKSPVAQSTKKPPGKGKKAEPVPEVSKKATPTSQKTTPKAKVAKAQDSAKEAAGGRVTRARK
ncbi:mucin-5AC-like [Phlebotomus argentipes]|uniref:mucin-5AC-like n=1 Tax=Phlebotomus argentipes TaxID=94469 RepID=UPI0028930F87|nr:mucin-5AC-like [Phlebotomus argentipes]XP_059619291.1 mucin-5AC-like [Phlebotomus argentipes]